MIGYINGRKLLILMVESCLYALTVKSRYVNMIDSKLIKVIKKHQILFKI